MSHATSVIHELQYLAADSNSDILGLLRKALIASTKLETIKFTNWIKSELNGYQLKAKLPAYRIVKSTLMTQTPYTGLIDVRFDNRKLEDLFTRTEIHDPISSLIGSTESKDKDGGILALPFNNDEHNILYSIIDKSIPRHPIYRVIASSDVANIIDNIRTTTLEWALKLESEGILGNGISFSAKEKEIAKMSNIHIQNFQGILGDISQSNITQELNISIANNKEKLFKTLKSNGLSEEDISALDEALNSDPTPKDASQLGENIKNWIKAMMSKSIDGSWNISLAAAGNLLSSAIATYYGLPK